MKDPSGRPDQLGRRALRLNQKKEARRRVRQLAEEGLESELVDHLRAQCE